MKEQKGIMKEQNKTIKNVSCEGTLTVQGNFSLEKIR